MAIDSRAGKKPKFDCLGQVNFVFGQVEIEVLWPNLRLQDE